MSAKVNTSEIIHKKGDGEWWYAPLTLASYWFCGLVCLWSTAMMLKEGRIDYLWKILRLFADDLRTVSFEKQPIAFSILLCLFSLGAIGFLVAGWLKFTTRRRRYLAHAKQF